MFMLYGIAVLPEITFEQGRPRFISEELPDFSVAYAGNWAGVVVATEGKCGLDMELQRTIINAPAEREGLSSNEVIWINNQTDPKEAWVQILAVRQSLGKLIGQPNNITHELQLLPGLDGCVLRLWHWLKRFVMQKICWCGLWQVLRQQNA